MIPDRAIVKQIQAIDADLSVAWIESCGRWAVFHALQLSGRPDETIDRMGRVLQQEASARGYSLDLADCLYEAAEAVKAARLVCYVTEDDGTYRPLDGRIVEKLQRMNWYRLNLGIRDWKHMLDAKAAILQERRQREENDFWECIRRDKVFASQASDILWGLKPARSEYVKGMTNEDDRECDANDGGAAGGTTADHHGTDGDALAPQERCAEDGGSPDAGR